MRDMTVGAAHSHLWRYALPILIGNWLQLGYNAVDSMIAGRFIGREALAAEGIAGPVIHLVILAVTGLCIGAGVLMSEAFGAKAFDQLRKTLAAALFYGAVLCCAATALGIALTPAILRRMAVPAEIRDITALYLRVIFLGTPFTFFYNALSTALKSVGDSRTPLKFLAFSSILNAVLDLIFLGWFKLGIVCSAVTTVVAEAVSALLAGGYMMRRFGTFCPRKGDWARDGRLLGKILSYGAPTALQQAIMPVGKILIQGQVNALGVDVIAAFNAVTRVDDFACVPEMSLSSAISTYIAQNRGAKKMERIRPGLCAGIRLELGYWVLIACAVTLFRTPIVALFVTGQGVREIVALGSRYLRYMAFFYLVPALNNSFQGFYRGMGKMLTTMLGTLLQISVRTLGTMLLAPRMGIVGVAFACGAGWLAMLLFEMPYYFLTCGKKAVPR